MIDESFADFADKPYTLLDRDFLAKYPHVSVMKSISKSFGIPGLRLGVLASNRTAVFDLIKKNLSIWNINSFGEYFPQIYEKHKANTSRPVPSWHRIAIALSSNSSSSST